MTGVQTCALPIYILHWIECDVLLWKDCKSEGLLGISELKNHGFHTVSMALRCDSVSIDDPKLSSKQKLAVILGSEGEGLLDETIDNCDDTVCIPMFHGVDSLNVAAASAVAFWELGKK